jgi:hypothetical protein
VYRTPVIPDDRHEPSERTGGEHRPARYAATKGRAIVIPYSAWAGGIAAAMLIGVLAGLLPAIRAARLAPADALRTV